jgi:hypothetical protein
VFSPTQIIGAVVIFWEGIVFFILNEWTLQTDLWIPHSLWIQWDCIAIFAVGLGAIGFTTFPFAWELCERAAS